MSVPQNEIIKDVLAFIEYDSGGFQIGEVKSHLKSDFPFIQWSLHLIQDTLLSGRFSSRDGYCGVLEQVDSLTPFTLAFSPKGVITQDMCVWASTAALLGFDVIPYSDLGMKPRIVIVHYDDYNHSRLEKGIEMLESHGIKVLYAPPINENETKPYRDISNGTLELGYKPATWQVKSKPHRGGVITTEKRQKEARVRYIGEIDGPLKAYFDGRNSQAIYDGIIREAEKLTHSGGVNWREKAEPENFVKAISLGHFSLPDPPAMKWSAPKDAWHVENTLEKTDILINAEHTVELEVEKVADTINDYIRIWEECCGQYCMTPKRESFKVENKDKIAEIAAFTGAQSAIEAYASGVAIDDILA